MSRQAVEDSWTASSVGTLSLNVAAKVEKQEEKFWKARRSLRMWPVEGCERRHVVAFLVEKLKMDGDFVEEELGSVTVNKVRDPRSKIKNEAIVTFETKQIRDAVKAKAAMASYGQGVGMRLELHDHLQKSFRALMNLAFDLKQKKRDLRRNIKFDEEDLGLYMDVQLVKDGLWKRVKPEQAKKLAKIVGRGGRIILVLMNLGVWLDRMRSRVRTRTKETKEHPRR